MPVSHITYSREAARYYAHFTNAPSHTEVNDALFAVGSLSQVLGAVVELIENEPVVAFILSPRADANEAMDAVRATIQPEIPYAIESMTVEVALKYCPEHGSVYIGIDFLPGLSAPDGMTTGTGIIEAIAELPNHLLSRETATAACRKINHFLTAFSIRQVVAHIRGCKACSAYYN